MWIRTFFLGDLFHVLTDFAITPRFISFSILGGTNSSSARLPCNRLNVILLSKNSILRFDFVILRIFDKERCLANFRERSL